MAPAIFDGAFLKNGDYSIVPTQNPAGSGDILLIYCTGLGVTTPAVTSGTSRATSPLFSPLTLPR
jgi:uncharacterized protein (TIGR03437 family)